MKKHILTLSMTLLISIISFGQNKATLSSSIELKKSSLALFIESYDYDSHLYDDNLNHLKEIGERKLEISKLETQKKLIGVKKGTPNYTNVVELGKIDLQRINVENEKAIKDLNDKKRKQDLELYELTHPSLIKDN